jgi:uncharacterized repeat protein (TIGR02543 family)
LPLFAPPVPNTPTSSGITATNITVSWTSGTAATGTDAGTSFEVYTSTSSTAPTSTTAGTTETSPKNYTYTASSSPSTRYFWVRAVNKDAKSAYSAVLSATPTARYTITYNGNTNTGGSTTATTGNGNVTLASNGFTKTGFGFVRWNTKADNTGTGYAAGATFNLTADTDLYAIWGALYTINFNSKGGSAVSSLTQSTVGGSIAKPTDPTRTGFTFGGWATTDGGTTAVTWPRTPASTETLYAIWTAQAVLYTVEFRANGATGSPSASSVTQLTAGASVTLATIGTMGGGTNRIFGGWRTGTSSGTVYAFGSPFTPTANIILYAYYGTAPTCAAPSWTQSANFRRVDDENQIIWFTDYPTPSGAWTEIVSMQFQIDTGSSGGGTRLADSTRAFPGFGSYPYTGAGSIWGFKCGKDRSSVTTNRVDDINHNTNARYARVRVRMRGIDGAIYTGTFSAWI